MHLLCIVGPPAVGKMTVGREVCRLTGYKLFHNHMSIEPLLGIFDFGSPSFERLNTMIRHEVVAESLRVDLPGLVFTYAWDFASDADTAAVRALIAPVVAGGARVDFVELYAAQPVRLAREGLADRLAHKRSKRDVEWARAHVIELESRTRLNTARGDRDAEAGWPGWPLPEHRHVRLENEHASPTTTAERIVAVLGLP